jgi:ketosteroid isomerase-like protein
MPSTASSITSFDLENLRAFARTFEELFYANDGESMAAFYTDNAWLAAEGINATRGIDGIRVFWKNACERGRQMGMKRSLAVDSCEMSGDLGYAVSTATLDLTAPNGQAVHRVVKDVTIWRRQANGTWKIEADISNPELG